MNTAADVNYDEFDDIERTGPYVSSAKAIAEMRRLASEFNLGFHFDPGGGEYFWCDGSRCCRVSTCDDVEDLHYLRKAVKTKSPSA